MPRHARNKAQRRSGVDEYVALVLEHMCSKYRPATLRTDITNKLVRGLYMCMVPSLWCVISSSVASLLGEFRCTKAPTGNDDNTQKQRCRSGLPATSPLRCL
jgi:hypothetical protein